MEYVVEESSFIYRRMYNYLKSERYIRHISTNPSTQ